MTESIIDSVLALACADHRTEMISMSDRNGGFAVSDPIKRKVNELMMRWAKERYGWTALELYAVKNKQQREELRADAIAWVEEDAAQAYAFAMQETLAALDELKK